MRWLKYAFIAIGVLVLIGFGSFTLYNESYSQGVAVGYDRGYSDGYSLGEQEGYDDGYISGEEDGYEEGYNSGETDGYEEGYEGGYEVGVEAGLGHGYTLRDPTYKEVVTFLRTDKTDKNKYDEDSYVCSHFARDVDNNAEKEGLRCAFVELRYPDGGHSIIAFEAVDKGLIYFDPQTDERVSPVVGRRYYKCIEPKPGFYYEKPSYDDTIEGILIIW